MSLCTGNLYELSNMFKPCAQSTLPSFTTILVNAAFMSSKSFLFSQRGWREKGSKLAHAEHNSETSINSFFRGVLNPLWATLAVVCWGMAGTVCRIKKKEKAHVATPRPVVDRATWKRMSNERYNACLWGHEFHRKYEWRSSCAEPRATSHSEEIWAWARTGIRENVREDGNLQASQEISAGAAGLSRATVATITVLKKSNITEEKRKRTTAFFGQET